MYVSSAIRRPSLHEKTQEIAKLPTTVARSHVTDSTQLYPARSLPRRCTNRTASSSRSTRTCSSALRPHFPAGHRSQRLLPSPLQPRWSSRSGAAQRAKAALMPDARAGVRCPGHPRPTHCGVTPGYCMASWCIWRRTPTRTTLETTTRLASVVALLFSLCAVTAGASPRDPRRLSAERRAEPSMPHAPPV